MNPKHLGAEIGMTMMLHTNSRSLDYHPHIHTIVPGGSIIRTKKQWKKKKKIYLFKQDNLAKVFRARFLAELSKCGFPIPTAPCQWVVDCRQVGKGAAAIKYFMEYMVDHYACARPSYKYAPKKLRFSKSRISRIFTEKIFPL